MAKRMDRVKSVVLALALWLGAGLSSALGRSFVIADEGGPAVEASLDKATARLSAMVLKRWRKANRHLPRDMRNEVADKAERVAVRRYVPMAREADSAVALRLAAMPIGLVVVSYAGTQLGYAYVNEAGGVEVFPCETPDLTSSTEGGGRRGLASVVSQRAPIVVAGINQPGKLLCGLDDGGALVDIVTGEETTLDMSGIPDYAFAEARHTRPQSVVLSIVGGGVAAGLIVLAALI